MNASGDRTTQRMKQPGPPGLPHEQPAAMLPTRHGDVFRYWQDKGALASDEALLRCLEQAQECIEQMNTALSCREKAFTLVHLEPTSHKTDAG